MAICVDRRTGQIIKYSFEKVNTLFNENLLVSQECKTAWANYLLTFSISMASPVIVPVIVTLSPI